MKFPRRLATILGALMGAAAALAAAPPGVSGLSAGAALEGRARDAFAGMLTEGDAHMTRVRLLTGNPEAFATRWAMIERAKRSIDMTYFVYSDDIYGRAILGQLWKKAKAGVRVRLMVDAFGARPIVGRGNGYLRALAALPTAEVKAFNPKLRFPRKFFPLLKTIFSANHDKILLIDGRLAMSGGRNIGAHYFAAPDEGGHVFRDSDILLDGEAVAGELERAFDEEWQRRFAWGVRPSRWRSHADHERELQLVYHTMRRWMLGSPPLDPKDSPYATELANLQAEVQAHPSLRGLLSQHWDRLWQGQRPYPTRILDKHGIDGDKNEITTGLVDLIDAAEDYILLQNAYVVLTAELAAALKRASDRGVRITIHTNGPKTTNQPITQAYFLRDWKKMLRDMPTLRLFASQGEETLHAKCFVIDDRLASVGSYNLDPLSQDINSEVIAVVDSPAFAVQNRLRIEKDLEESVEYRIELDENGVPRTIRGPEEELEGWALFWLKQLGRIPFLRDLI